MPPDSRDGVEPPTRIPLGPSWRRVGGAGGAGVYEVDLPFRPRALFFFSPLPGMTVQDGAGRIPYANDRAPGATSWRFNHRTLAITRPGDTPPVDATVSYPQATSRERRLNRGWSDASSDLDFVRTSLQIGPTTRAGLLLPAPSSASWSIEVPAGAALTARFGLVPPEISDRPPSDGAGVRVVVQGSGPAEEVWRGWVTDASFARTTVDLSQFSGQTVTLTLETEPGPTASGDYVLVADPVVAAPAVNPRRVLLVFVDTLRPDHLGTYGYPRDTSRSLDAFAADAAVFTQARSVAPWTLPSTRAVLTGRQPEAWDTSPTLAERLAPLGWATAMFAGNVYLSSNFDMDRGWGLHRVANKPSATEQVALARAWLDEHEDRDALLLLHFMDAHLDYREPLPWRLRYAGAGPASLGERFTRGEVTAARLDEAGRQYVVDRYDNTIAYVHDALAPLFEQLGQEDVLVYFADHGEEFWEHGGYEHGHTLYDELLRVPLVVDAPGVDGARLDAPVSLLDVAPTVIEALGLPADPPFDGRSLIGVASGRADPATFEARDLAFGRPLYGFERWGVLHDGVKFVTTEGKDERYDVRSDPGEASGMQRTDPEPRGPWVERMAVALGRPAVAAVRLVPTRSQGREPLEAHLDAPGGWITVWPGADPTQRSDATVRIDGTEVIVTWPGGSAGVREVWALPNGRIDEVFPTLSLTVSYKGADGNATPTAAAQRPTLRATANGRTVTVGVGVSLPPTDGLREVAGFDPELAAMLQALGYTGEP